MVGGKNYRLEKLQPTSLTERYIYNISKWFGAEVYQITREDEEGVITGYWVPPRGFSPMVAEQNTSEKGVLVWGIVIKSGKPKVTLASPLMTLMDLVEMFNISSDYPVDFMSSEVVQALAAASVDTISRVLGSADEWRPISTDHIAVIIGL